MIGIRLVERGGLEPGIRLKSLCVNRVATQTNPKVGLQGGCHPTVRRWVVEWSKQTNRCPPETHSEEVHHSCPQ